MKDRPIYSLYKTSKGVLAKGSKDFVLTGTCFMYTNKIVLWIQQHIWILGLVGVIILIL